MYKYISIFFMSKHYENGLERAVIPQRPQVHRDVESVTEPVVRPSIDRLALSAVRDFQAEILDGREPVLEGKQHKYAVQKLLGEGGMGQVWQAQREDGMQVVIKIIKPELARLNDNGLHERFIQEGLVLEEIDSRHFPGFLEVDEACTVIVMESVEGQPVINEIHANTIDVMDAAIIGAEVADGMAHAHSKGFVHRDLKPENIMVTPDRSRVTILDFGIAYLFSWKREKKRRGTRNRITIDDAALGTPQYMAPEIFTGQEGDINAPADVFSLGVVLYEILSKGHVPYPYDTVNANGQQKFLQILTKVLDEKYVYTKLEKLNPTLPVALTALVDRMLQRNPAQRPTMEQVRDTLRDFLRDYAQVEDESDVGGSAAVQLAA